MHKILLAFIVIFMVTSCASKNTKKPVISYERDVSLEYQNTICALSKEGKNNNKMYITFGVSDNYEKAPIEDLKKVYGEKQLNSKRYPIEYSSSGYLSGYFNLQKNCDTFKFFVVVEDVKLLKHFVHLGKMGSGTVEYYLIVKVSINGKINKTYTALTETKKYNAFTSGKNTTEYNIDAKKSAFKAIFKQIDDDLKQLNLKDG